MLLAFVFGTLKVPGSERVPSKYRKVQMQVSGEQDDEANPLISFPPLYPAMN